MIPFWRQSFYDRVIGLTPVWLKGGKGTFYFSRRFITLFYMVTSTVHAHGGLQAGRLGATCRRAFSNFRIDFLGPRAPPLLAFAHGTDGARLAR